MKDLTQGEDSTMTGLSKEEAYEIIGIFGGLNI